MGEAGGSFAACAQHAQPDERPGPTQQARAQLNSSPGLNGFAVLASNSVVLSKNARVLGGDVGVKNAGAGPFLMDGNELGLQRFAQVQAGELFGDSVRLLENASAGDINTNQLTNSGGSYVAIGPFPV